MKNSSFLFNITHHQPFGKPCLRKVLDAFEILMRHRNPTRGSCILRAFSRKPLFWSARHSSGPSEHTIKRQQMINSWAKKQNHQKTCDMQLQCMSLKDHEANAWCVTSAILLHSRDSNSIIFFHSQIYPKTKVAAKTASSVLLQSFIFISDWVAIHAGPTFSSVVKTMAQATEWLEQVQWQWSALGLDYT